MHPAQVEPTSPRGFERSQVEKAAPSESVPAYEAFRFDPGAPALIAFPNLDDYETYFDFELALLDWRKDVENALGSLQLPCVLGRHVYRPSLQAVDDKPNSLYEIEIETSGSPADVASPLAEVSSRSRSSSMALDIHPRKRHLDADSWGSLLVHPEPEAEMYLSFAEYEQAMMKWARLVVEQVPVIPPHASQLADLLGLERVSAVPEDGKAADGLEQGVVRPRGTPGQADQLVSLQLLRWRGGVPVVSRHPWWKPRTAPPHHSLTFNVPRPPPQDLAPPMPLSPKIPYSTLLPEAKDAIEESFTKMLNLRLESMAAFKAYTPPLLPRLHGTFRRKETAGPRKVGSLRSVRRQDLTVRMMQACYDCPGQIDGQTVDFLIPEHDIEALDLKKLQSQGDYGHTAHEAVRLLNDSGHSDSLYSWYHPKVPKKDQEAARQAADALMRTEVPANPDTVVRLAAIPMFLDVFEAMIQDYVPISFRDVAEDDDRLLGADDVDNDSNITYMEALLEPITADTFPAFIKHFDLVEDPACRAKMASFVERVVQSSRSKAIIEALVISGNVDGLYHLATAMSIFSKVVIDIFPFQPDLLPTLERLMGDVSYMQILTQSLIGYYLSIIQDRINSNAVQYVAVALTISDARRQSGRELSRLLLAFPEFLPKHALPLLAHHSHSVSSFFLFFMLHLMGLKGPEFVGVQEALRAPRTNLVNAIRGLGYSRFIHARYAFQQLWSDLRREEWQEFLCQSYLAGQSAFDDIISLSVSCGPRSDPARAPQSLVSRHLVALASDLIVAACKPGPAQAASCSQAYWVLDTKLFLALLEYVLAVKEAGAHTISDSSVVAASVLAHQAAAYHRLGLLETTKREESGRVRGATVTTPNTVLSLSPVAVPPVASPVSAATPTGRRLGMFGQARTRSTSGTVSQDNPTPDLSVTIGLDMLAVRYTDLRSIIQFVGWCPNYALKTNMLVCLRHLLKHATVFSLVKTEIKFFQEVVQFCRDGTDLRFNRESWRLFYQMVRHHHGVLELLTRPGQGHAQGILGPLLDAVAPGAPDAVIINGLHYLRKLFTMASDEQRRVSEGKMGVREGDIKSLDKDVKTLVAFYIKSRLFIKTHMIFKKFDTSDRRHGAPFLELVALYHVICTHPACSRLLKDLMKRAEFKDGLMKIEQMYNPGAKAKSGWM